MIFSDETPIRAEEYVQVLAREHGGKFLESRECYLSRETSFHLTEYIKKLISPVGRAGADQRHPIFQMQDTKGKALSLD